MKSIKIEMAILKIELNNTKNQFSDLRALPEKTDCFSKARTKHCHAPGPMETGGAQYGCCCAAWGGTYVVWGGAAEGAWILGSDGCALTRVAAEWFKWNNVSSVRCSPYK